MHPAGRTRSVVIVVLAAWLAAVAVPPAALSVWRAKRLAELSEPGVQEEWDAFREAMRKESGRDGPVQRKVPKSAEPPELVWLRDYFSLAVMAWVTLMGVLGGFVAALVMGVTSGRKSTTGRGSPDPSRPPPETTPA
jgi:hypothetical protein